MKTALVFKRRNMKKQSRSTLIRKLDTVFSKYIRLRDAMPEGYFVCISCGNIKPISQADCGHFIGRQHMSLRYSELNCNAQCRYCNRFCEGEHVGYRRRLIQKIGEKNVLLLEAQKNTTTKLTNYELEAMINHYSRLVKELSAEKGLKI